MASVVSIKINIDNGQALPSIDQLNSALKTVGVQGTASFQQMNGHAATGLDSVRLLSQEFGLRLPRAIESMLSRMPAVTSALGSMLGVMAGIAAAQVFVHVAEEAYRAYEQYVSLNAQADKFYETLRKTQQEDVVNTRSIETTQRRLGDATSTGSVSPGVARADQSGAIGSLLQGDIPGFVAQMTAAHVIATQGVQAESDMVKLSRTSLDQAHQRALAQIELNHAMDSTLGTSGKIAADDAKKRQVDAENRSYDRNVERISGNPSPANAGADEQRMKDAQADAEASAQSILLARKERDERITAQNAAIEAGLEGEAKYEAQRDASIAAITRRFQDGEISRQTAMSVTASLSLKYDNERASRLQIQWQQAQQATREAQQSGLTGGARISAEHDNSIDKINTDRTLDPEVAAQLRQAAATTASQKMQALEDSFSDHVKSLDAGRVESSQQAFDKINTAAQRQIAQLQKLYDDDFKNAQTSDAQKLEANKNLQSGISAINAAAAEQRQQLSQRNADEDLRYEQQAAEAEKRVRDNGINGWIESYKNGITEIQAQEAARLAKLDEDVKKEGLTQQEAQQRQTDVVREANADVAQQNQQMQQKIAGDLQAAFTNPVDFIKSQMEKMFFEIVAGWIMRMNVFKTLFGQTMGGLQPGAPSGAPGAAGAGAGAGGLMDRLVHGAGGFVNGHPNISSIYESIPGASGTASAISGHSAAGGGGSAMSTVNEASTAAHAIAGMRGGGNIPLAAPTFGPSSTGTGGGSLSGSAGSYHAPSSVGSSISEVSSAANTLSQVAGAGGFGGSSPASAGDTSALSGAQAAQPSVSDTSADTGFASYQTGHSADLSLTAEGQQAQAESNDSLKQGLGIAGVVGTAGYTAEQSTVKAFDNGDPLSGAVGDASAGAAIGSLFGPEGTLIGAGIGAGVGAAAGLVGLVAGEGGNLAARSYYEQSVLPTLESDMSNPNGDFQSADSSVGTTSSQALAYMTQKWGKSAADWVNVNYMQKEVNAVLQRINDVAAGGHQYTTLSASQFHTGGTISGFGSLGTSSNEGFIHAMLNETVMNTQASTAHGPVLSAMNSGASASDVASMYLAGANPSGGTAPAAAGDTHNWSVNALDAKSFSSFLKSGGAQLIVKHTNTYASEYAGDGISG